jgi:hypothetical protein
MYRASVEKERTGSHVVTAADAATENTADSDAFGAGVQPAEPSARTTVADVARTTRDRGGNENANRDSLKKGGKCDESN